MSLYWLQQTLAVYPLVIWVYFALGIPYALLALPRSDWGRRFDVIALAFAFGPALLTAWMLILGTIGGTQEQAYLRFDVVLGGTVILAMIGYSLLWRKLKNGTSITLEHVPLAFDERLLIALIIIAVFIRWLVTSYWSFTAYDALWVYGYEGRLYQLLGYIPQDIGYYPQFIPLQYTFLQLLSDGFDDHAARAIIPFLHIGSILASYVMGSRLFTRRVGIIAAAIWTLYPHVALWAHVGDLEIPLTFLLTLTMTFFLVAWQAPEQGLRRRYALIAGLCFGIAMWTKPTGGAFIWGVMLLVVAAFVLARFNLKRWLPHFEVALITGLACIPLGAIWYIRNLALGLPALVFPHPSWLTLATRSGDLLSFPILALLLMIAYLASTRKLQYSWLILIGVVLLVGGAMPSSPLIDEARRNAPASYISLWEAIAIIVGFSLIIWALRHQWRTSHTELQTITWSYLLILPYFMTWFWSYSYHARLSFAIVPFMILPIAVIAAHWLSADRVSQWKLLPKIAWSLLLIVLSVQAIRLPIVGIAGTSDYLWVDRYPNDFIRTQTQNPGVSLVAEQLWGYQATYGIPPVVVAPGEQRLRFFLPDATIISDTIPTTYEELAGATHFIYGTQPRWRYERDSGIMPLDNRIVASLGRSNLFKKVLDFEDGTFEYELYELTLDARYDNSVVNAIEDEVIFGDAIRYTGDILNNRQLLGNRVGIQYLWEVINPLEADYYVQLEIYNIDDEQVYRTFQTPVAPSEDGYYRTTLWEVGEFVLDEHSILLDYTDMPIGAELYQIIINFVDVETGEVLPMTINGEPARGYPMSVLFSLGS
ncbi:MAG: glycosyltransferase family 39 protein [Phototrophicaceae bacterium]